MNRKTLVLPAVIGLLAPVLAACGAPDGGGKGGDAIVVGTTDQFVATKDAPAPFDPAFAYDAGAWNVLRQTVQMLMHVPRGGGEPVPDAASKCGFTDTQNESFRCTLRSGLKFADGDALTAEDVKFSVERVLKIKNNNGPVALLSNIDTIETNGDHEIVFHLRTPDATFPYKIATPAAAIVDSGTYKADKLRDGFDADGSGPYTLTTETEGDRVVKAVFTKNPQYKGDLELKNDKIELRSFADTESMEKALKDGDISLMTRTLQPEQIKDLSENPAEGIDLIEMPGLEIRYLGFDTEDSTVKSRAVRQALAAVVDRGDLASKVYPATAEPLYSLIPNTITGHRNAFFNKYGEPNRPKAAGILRSAGISTPVKLTLNYTTDHYGPATKKEFEVLQEQLNSTNLFDADIKGTEWSKFRDSQKRGEYAVYGMGWFPDFPDADNYVAPFLDEDNFLNSPYVNSEARNKLIPESRRAADRAAAAGPFERIQEIVANDVPVLPLWQGKQYVAARDDITGVEWAVNSSADLQLWELGRGVA
ncbi:peptide-binding protein [Streptomyces agglomeratus]|uniref:Peptide-binding protein n=1 Tax=Streptomyces agglomeratus TaxID=285458 RepID=A0A1E5PDV1_9ACTN|nr:ABC transporter substrate-binding protein [Streptomyces agglomeratus]OEJ27707.1 peptide-binding protein [Streptomyces agglomeratus]OEJ38232.1 peptide-binding protein [Streptomyces agglomeratus]OEJ47383.1 peptide-binding protein [Streptomyces agglomeratus]OEJ50760.1 peptide-binding protein [Streptomyces agglomeratus]OEJ58122.1 peptide-binding protein [Streptomyces agglomeratus]